MLSRHPRLLLDTVKIQALPSFPEREPRPGETSKAKDQALPELGPECIFGFSALMLDIMNTQLTPSRSRACPAWGGGGRAVWHVGSAQTRPDGPGPGAEGGGLMSSVPRPPRRENHSPSHTLVVPGQAEDVSRALCLDLPTCNIATVIM